MIANWLLRARPSNGRNVITTKLKRGVRTGYDEQTCTLRGSSFWPTRMRSRVTTAR